MWYARRRGLPGEAAKRPPLARARSLAEFQQAFPDEGAAPRLYSSDAGRAALSARLWRQASGGAQIPHPQARLEKGVPPPEMGISA
jgi:hypothetical protein